MTAAAAESPWTWVLHGSRRPDDGLEMTWDAASFEFDSNAAYYTRTFVVPAGETPSRDAVRDWLESRDRAVDASAVDVRIDGRTVTAEMRVPAGEYRRGIDSQSGEWPQITWSVERDAETVTHEAGAPVATSWLTAEYYPTRQEVDDAFASVGDTLEPGDSARSTSVRRPRTSSSSPFECRRSTAIPAARCSTCPPTTMVRESTLVAARISRVARTCDCGRRRWRGRRPRRRRRRARARSGRPAPRSPRARALRRRRRDRRAGARTPG